MNIQSKIIADIRARKVGKIAPNTTLSIDEHGQAIIRLYGTHIGTVGYTADGKIATVQVSVNGFLTSLTRDRVNAILSVLPGIVKASIAGGKVSIRSRVYGDSEGAADSWFGYTV